MVYGTEKPTTRRGRIVIVAVVWLILGVPLTIALWLLLGWWTLLPIALAAWATWDYIKRGGSIEGQITRFGAGLPIPPPDDKK